MLFKDVTGLNRLISDYFFFYVKHSLLILLLEPSIGKLGKLEIPLNQMSKYYR